MVLLFLSYGRASHLTSKMFVFEIYIRFQRYKLYFRMQFFQEDSALQSSPMAQVQGVALDIIQVTITAVFRTNFPVDFPYDPQELLVFSLIGIICGAGGALYCFCHRQGLNGLSFKGYRVQHNYQLLWLLMSKKYHNADPYI